ncbi:MAG TPA: TonB-dependent receptor, partial [Sediminibacterium sp.]|nr:TonB-dependent receptor [Sediminibacterium sp.]
MFKKTGSLVLATMLFLAGTFAQTHATNFWKLHVTTSDKHPLENITVALLRSRDSSLVAAAITNGSGEAELAITRAGNYLLLLTASGFEKTWYGPVNVSDTMHALQIPDLVMTPAANKLQEVVVTTRRPFLQRLTDRLIVNVDNSIISAGSSAFEVLERSPGVVIDQNDAISLRGKQGVIIMIDGKPSPLTGSDLANYLRGLPSNAIDRIELITNPSAKYDAAGNAGIIDIRMKKDQRLGANGTLTAGYGQGIYPKANTGANFNYRNKTMNVFGNYNYSYRMNLNHLVLDRNFYTNGTYNGGDLKDNYTKTPSNFHTVRAGADFFAGKKDILGFVVSYNNGDFNSHTLNQSIVLDKTHTDASTFETVVDNQTHNQNTVANLNYRHQFKQPGTELSMDADYGVYNNRLLSLNTTHYYQLNGAPLQPDYILQGDQNGQLKLRTVKADFSGTLAKKWKLETGAKYSFVSSDNDARFYDRSSGNPVTDTTKTNHFLYDEYNDAGYFTLNRTFGKWELKAGLRAERTHIKTYQVNGDIHFDSSYLQWFPSAFITYTLKEGHTIGASISRRIDRPGYSQLNPFLFLIDVTTYATGNPSLLPQFTWSYELNYTYHQFNLSLAYSHTAQIQNIAIARFKDVFPNIPQADNVTVQIPINLQSSDYYGITLAAPIQIGKRWNMLHNANLYYSNFHGSLGATVLQKGRPALDYRMNNSVLLGKGWTAELNGSFNSGEQYGFMVLDPQWGIAAGLQKSLP